MTPHSIKVVYGRGRFPVQPAKKKCRGCHCDVPKGRRSWCSTECYNAHEPRRVRWFCEQRDKCVCCICGVDAEKMRKRCEHAIRFEEPEHYRYWHNWGFDRARYEHAVRVSSRHKQRWLAAAKKRISDMRAAGWPSDMSRDWWQMDHIVPFSEGRADRVG